MALKARKAIFLDRDGTLIYDKHYLSDPKDVELIPGAGDALARALDMGYALFLFSNQSGVGRGYFSLDDVRACNDRMVQLMGFDNSPFLEECLADETPDQPQVYRKPSPRFIDEMVEKYQLDVTHCYMVGDKASDWEAGINSGVQPIAVKTGKLFKESDTEFIENHPVMVYDSIVDFIGILE